MKIRLTQPGFENLTGYVGVVEFLQGVSVRDVTEREAARIAASIKVETVPEKEGEKPVNPSVSDLINRIKEVSAEVRPSLEARLQANGRAAEEAAKAAAEAKKAEAEQPVVEPVAEAAPVAEVPVVYTDADLSRVADEQGIAGLREIASKLNVRGQSIKGLMAGILAAQNGAAAPSDATPAASQE